MTDCFAHRGELSTEIFGLIFFAADEQFQSVGGGGLGLGFIVINDFFDDAFFFHFLQEAIDIGAGDPGVAGKLEDCLVAFFQEGRIGFDLIPGKAEIRKKVLDDLVHHLDNSLTKYWLRCKVLFGSCLDIRHLFYE